jgi:hypothetical protein
MDPLTAYRRYSLLHRIEQEGNVQQWDYKIVKIDDNGHYAERPYYLGEWAWVKREGGYARIDALGKAGWEIISVSGWAPCQTHNDGDPPGGGHEATAVLKRVRRPSAGDDDVPL